MVSDISRENSAPFRGQVIPVEYEDIAFFRNSGNNFLINIILNSVRQHNHFITQGNYEAIFFDYKLVIFRPIFVN